ncbi:MAG: YerC/YecD family TrpR-related protein [Oscillospiraceae bacterium]|nr:YerC/YecD family TrpR-related protein [Oscillospiraceae bacterium]
MDCLMKAIISITDMENCYSFFDDLCTIPELKAMSQRFEVAKMLTQGSGYNDIMSKTGASSATISRVSKCLQYGSGYKSALSKNKKI